MSHFSQLQLPVIGCMALDMINHPRVANTASFLMSNKSFDIQFKPRKLPSSCYF